MIALLFHFHLSEEFLILQMCSYNAHITLQSCRHYNGLESFYSFPTFLEIAVKVSSLCHLWLCWVARLILAVEVMYLQNYFCYFERL